MDVTPKGKCFMYLIPKHIPASMYVVHRLDEETQRMVLDEEELTFGCGDGRTDSSHTIKSQLSAILQ